MRRVASPVLADHLNRQSGITQQSISGGYAVDEKQVTLGYDAASRLWYISEYGSGNIQPIAQASYGYDRASRLTALTWSGYGGGAGSSADIYEEFSWAYDDASRVAWVANAIYSGENQTYSYNDDSELGGVAGDGGSFGYHWDSNGNPNSQILPDGYGGTYSLGGYITGAGNRLLSDGTWNYVYDANGNLKKQTSGSHEIDYSWDNRNRLVSVKSYNFSGLTLTLNQTQEVDYKYDMFDRLIGRSFSSYTGGSVTGTVTSAFVYDGGNMVLAFNGSGAITDRYLWGPAVDQILADEQYSSPAVSPTAPGNTLWDITDNQGTVHDVAVYNGLAGHFIYDAFGKVTSGALTLFLHNGTFYDPATGLELHGERWYNPSIQRWMSPDPAGLTFDSNPYRYCGNSPTNYVDPSGTNIYLDTGNNTDGTGPGAWCNNQFHQQIGVDLWDQNGNRNGRKYFSFGTDENALWSTGYVYSTDRVWESYTTKENITTMAEDQAFLKRMEGMVDQSRSYSVILPGRLNCRDFSQDEFNKAPGKIKPPRVLPLVGNEYLSSTPANVRAQRAIDRQLEEVRRWRREQGLPVP